MSIVGMIYRMFVRWLASAVMAVNDFLHCLGRVLQ